MQLTKRLAVDLLLHLLDLKNKFGFLKSFCCGSLLYPYSSIAERPRNVRDKIGLEKFVLVLPEMFQVVIR